MDAELPPATLSHAPIGEPRPELGPRPSAAGVGPRPRPELGPRPSAAGVGPRPRPDLAPRTLAARVKAGPAGRLSAGPLIAIGAVVGLVVVAATDQILPASSEHQAEMRIWLVSRATGFTALAMMTFQIAFGLVLSHPTNKSTWRLSKQLFPLHENIWVFVLAFLAAHVVSTIADPYAGVGIVGSFVPGLSSFRAAPVALGTLAMYALVFTGLTARYTKLLPAGVWLKVHRLSLVVFVLAWMHGLVAGSDSTPLLAFYVITGGVVLAAGAYRYWVSRAARPTFSTSLQEGPRR
jgi:methionine sulfoxide reductase heme-binding subunit